MRGAPREVEGCGRCHYDSEDRERAVRCELRENAGELLTENCERNLSDLRINWSELRESLNEERTPIEDRSPVE